MEAADAEADSNIWKPNPCQTANGKLPNSGKQYIIILEEILFVNEGGTYDSF